MLQRVWQELDAGLMCVMLWAEHILNICNVPKKIRRVFLSININYVYLRYIKLE
jgi:hypothetical protein